MLVALRKRSQLAEEAMKAEVGRMNESVAAASSSGGGGAEDLEGPSTGEKAAAEEPNAAVAAEGEANSNAAVAPLDADTTGAEAVAIS